MAIDAPRCPECGYTAQDALIHWDHWRCKGKIPGYAEAQDKGDGGESRHTKEPVASAPNDQPDEKKRGALRQYEYLIAAKDFTNPDEVRERVRALDRLAGSVIRESLSVPKREISEEEMAEYIYNGRHKPCESISNPWKHLLGFHGTSFAAVARKYRDVARLAIEAFSKVKP